ncbi:hypothetical protein HYE67_009576 [Fusarium culmorum]|uniref:Cell wall protein SED1 n=1 Tax=Fusarium culmorum TaxID=5516 RepID=A0A7S8I074_FUSCU|nr:hypothetical protein HYE67_009576 [Fusarium culmorum]
MKTAAYMAMAFGLASAFENAPRHLDEPCECELEDPCYVAVQANKVNLCGPNVFSQCDINLIPAQCTGDTNEERRQATGANGVSTTGATVPYTTKTVYTTAVNTYTKCPDYVKDCPAGGNGPYTVTETVAVSTTVCPVTEEHPSKPTGYSPEKYTTKTIYSTEVYTITKCPPSVKDCPYGSVTTKTYPVSTTVCAVTEEHPSKPTGYAPVTEGHPSKPTGYAPPNTSTLYTTKTTYSTKVYTVTECGPEVKDCPYGSVKTETVPCTTVYATGTKEIPSYPTVPEEPAKPHYPAPPAAETDSGYKAPAPSQPSATVPYHQPTGTAPAVEVTAGASRFGVEMAVAAAGIFAILL